MSRCHSREGTDALGRRRLKLPAKRVVAALFGGGVVVTALVVLALSGIIGSGPSADDGHSPGSPVAVATPPPLPVDCRTFMASYRLDSHPPKAGQGAGSAEIHASTCAVAAFAGTPLEALALTIEARLEAPGGPLNVSSAFVAERTADGLVWRGEITYPQPGIWEPTFRIAGVETRGGYVQVLDADLDLTPRPGLPSPAMTLPLTVVNTDGSGEAVTWEVVQSDGTGWLRGEREGDPARPVWVQQRDGANWLVSSDVATREVTPLFEVRANPTLIAAPDGRAIVVVEIARPEATTRIRLFNAANGALTDLSSAVEPSAGTFPGVSWSPDASTVLLVGRELRVLNSDGSLRFSSPEGSKSPTAFEWATDSSFALVELHRTGDHGAPSQRLVRVDRRTSTVQTMLDYGNGIERAFYGNPVAISPDGRHVAFTWVGTSPGRMLHLAVLPADQPFGSDIATKALVSRAAPSAPSQERSWIAAPAWSPDGRRVAFATASTGAPGTARGVTGVHIVDVQTGDVREITRAPSGYYVGPVAWSSDNAVLFAYRLSSVESHGGTSSVDVVDVTTGATVQTITGALGTAGDLRLFSAPGHLYAARGGRLRTLLNEPRMGGYLFVAASPDARRVAVLGLPGPVHTIAAIAPDGTGRESLGTIERGATFPAALRGTDAVLAPVNGTWAWWSLAGAAPQAIPLPAGVADTSDGITEALTLAPDGQKAAYWLRVTPDDQRPRLAKADIEAGTAMLIDVQLQRPGGSIVWSRTSDRFAFSDGPRTLVIVDAASGATRAIDLAAAGVVEAPPLPGVVALAWDVRGERINLVAGRQLWRLDLATGKATKGGALPSPGGWWGEVTLSRSPDGKTLAAGTPFGVFVQQDDGTWKRISRAGVGEFQSPLVWSPDGSQVAYASRGITGIVVARADGTGAYELVSPWPSGPLRVLSWLPDGRVAYAVLLQGV